MTPFITFPLQALPFDPCPLVIPPLPRELTMIPGMYHFALDSNGQVQRFHLKNKCWDELPIFKLQGEGSALLRLNIGKVKKQVPLWLIWAHTYLPCPTQKHHVFQGPTPYYLSDPLELAWVEPERARQAQRKPHRWATVSIPEILALIPDPDLRPCKPRPHFPATRYVDVPLPPGLTKAEFIACLLSQAHKAPDTHPDYHLLEAICPLNAMSSPIS